VPELTDQHAARRPNVPALRVCGLSKSFGTTPAVSDISFEMGVGEVLTLLGPSGCGKSTTLRLVAGLERPDAGEIWVGGRLVASGDGRIMVPPEGRKVGLVFQSYAIWPHMTVAENIGYPLKARRIDRGTIAAKVAEMIRLVKLDGLGGRMPTELSGGQQQRVALARALVYEPDLLLLDEPLSNLDSVLRKEMRVGIKALQSRLGTTVLYVTHDQEEAMSLSNRVAVMNHGRIEQVDPPDEVYERPATRFVEGFVGRTIRLRGVIEGGAAQPRIRIGSSAIEATGDALPPPGTAVEVSMRPEDVSLQMPPPFPPPHSPSQTRVDALSPGESKGGVAAGNCLAGQIIEATYFGDRQEYAIRIDGANEQVVTIAVGKRQRTTRGDRILLGIDVARIKLWPL
jgi:ABC-type Fe3+/spermidine/putrescine transport system ATPase subunit